MDDQFWVPYGGELFLSVSSKNNRAYEKKRQKFPRKKSYDEGGIKGVLLKRGSGYSIKSRAGKKNLTWGATGSKGSASLGREGFFEGKITLQKIGKNLEKGENDWRTL